ncbi:MAG: hypothetical protein KC484_02950 [Colwelliaceae bacterium]|nr:hypothetical protein [Colwelliaceae bacterium]
MDRVKITVLVVFLGLLYAYLSVGIIGIGAAIAIPSEIIDVTMKSYPIFTFAVIDLITIGLPLIIVYLLFAVLIRYLNMSKSYVPYIALLLPFFGLNIYFFSMLSPQDWEYTLGTIILRHFAIIACAIYFIKWSIRHEKPNKCI